MPEYFGLKIDTFGDILFCPRMKTHGYCGRQSLRPGKQTITLRVALSGWSISLRTYKICISKIQLQHVSNVYYSTHTLSYIYRLSNSNCYLPKSRSEPGKNPKY